MSPGQSLGILFRKRQMELCCSSPGSLDRTSSLNFLLALLNFCSHPQTPPSKWMFSENDHEESLSPVFGCVRIAKLCPAATCFVPSSTEACTAIDASQSIGNHRARGAHSRRGVC